MHFQTLQNFLNDLDTDRLPEALLPEELVTNIRIHIRRRKKFHTCLFWMTGAVVLSIIILAVLISENIVNAWWIFLPLVLLALAGTANVIFAVIVDQKRYEDMEAGKSDLREIARLLQIELSTLATMPPEQIKGRALALAEDQARSLTAKGDAYLDPFRRIGTQKLLQKECQAFSKAKLFTPEEKQKFLAVA